MTSGGRMHDCPAFYLAVARVPRTVPAGNFGLWHIVRQRFSTPALYAEVGGPVLTALCRWTMATMHQPHGEVVMEDSRRELRKHLPIWLHGRGRILVTGLGLGCVVRGLLAKPDVEHIDVVELDPLIIRRIGMEFAGQPRVTVHQGDALTWEPPAAARWDFAWHDIWTEGNEGLATLHAQIMDRFRERVGKQGAWGLPRAAKPWLREAGLLDIG